MHISSTLCRAQQIYQRDRAATAVLANIQTIAAAAAKAWEKEALAAEGRDDRQIRSRGALPIALGTVRSDRDRERAFSENPDREFPSD
jgi:hypothetical protein